MSKELRRIKLRVSGPDQMKAALTYLFANGCRQSGSSAGTDVNRRPDSTHLFVDEQGRVTYINDGDDRYFREQEYKEVTPRWDVVVTSTVTMSMPERPKTVLFGKTYFTDELEQRLAGLKVVPSL